MYIIKNGIKEHILCDSLSLLSDKGTEFLVYYYDNKVYKVFKDDYKLGHKTIEELNYLISIKTSRILMPESLILDNGSLIGYSMPYINNSRDLFEEKMSYFINELENVIFDIEILNNYSVRLIDINKNNIIYNGSLYFIDPGNYYINDIKDLLQYIGSKEPSLEERKYLIKIWNYNRFNKLIVELLFMNNSDVDFYILRKIIEFFDKQKKEKNILYDIPIYKEYFDGNLKVKDSINKFIKDNIKIDPEEKQIIYKLIYHK